MGDRARRAQHRSLAPRHRAVAQPPALAHRPRRRPRAAAADRVRAGLGRDQARVRAGVRLRRAGRRLVLRRLRDTARRSPARRAWTSSCGWSPICGSGSRARGHARGRRCTRARSRSSRSAGQSTRCPSELRGGGGAGWRAPRRFWQEWLKHGTFPDHPWRSYLQRSALTLKGLTYAPSGAMVAAATTSLPETPGGDRNWDYRYSWIRDSTFMLWALYTLGFDEEANDFFYFVADMVEAEEGQLQVMYGIGGESKLLEQELEHLSGYDHARPGADRERRLQPAASTTSGARCSTRSTCTPARAISCRTGCGRSSSARSRRRSHTGGSPDRGIWEVRGEPRHFTSSKLMCWVAADRGARLARIRADEATATALGGRRRLRSTPTSARTGSIGAACSLQHYETEALDASVLLMPLVRFLPPDDPRIRDTVLAIADELTEEGLVLRYRVDETDDGFAGEEGTFTICSFWLVSALVEIGELARARGLCEKLLSLREPARAVCRADRPDHRPPPRQLPAGVHAPGADQRGRPHHRRRAPARAARARARARAGPARRSRRSDEHDSGKPRPLAIA